VGQIDDKVNAYKEVLLDALATLRMVDTHAANFGYGWECEQPDDHNDTRSNGQIVRDTINNIVGLLG